MSELSELSEFIRNSLHPGLTKAVQDHFSGPRPAPKPANLGSGMAAKAAQAEANRPQQINNAVDEASR